MNNSSLNGKWVWTEVYKVNNFLELDENESTAWPKLWDAMQCLHKERHLCGVSNVTAHLKDLEQRRNNTQKGEMARNNQTQD